MITNFISPAGRKILIAWETAGQVFYADVVPGTDGASESVAAPGPGSDRKHPVVARNSRGETLLAWTNGTGWQPVGPWNGKCSTSRDVRPMQEARRPKCRFGGSSPLTRSLTEGLPSSIELSFLQV